MQKLQRIYSALLIFAGLLAVVSGIIRFPAYDDPLILFLLLVLAVTAQSIMLPDGAAAKIYADNAVSGVISFAVIGLYGPAAGAMTAAIAEAGRWAALLFARSQGQKRNRRRDLLRSGVAAGIRSMSVLTAGFVFLLAQNRFGANAFLGQTLPWLIGAAAANQVNFWLSAGIAYLTNGSKPAEIWRENRQVMLVNVLAAAVGGGLFFLAVNRDGLLATAVFALPLALSAYTFRLAVKNTRKQINMLERRQMYQTQDLAAANRKLKNLDKEKNAFLAVLTHDMRTPLTSIKGYASVLRDREFSFEEQQKIAGIILRSQDMLLDIVNNIVDLGKMESGKSPVLLESASFDLALLTKVSADSLQAQAAGKRISLEYDTTPSPIMITADMNKIQRVILNLISNAIKYTPENGRVQVRAYANGRNALVEVKDNGYGIPEDELPAIFDWYSRGQGHRRLAVGAGLGLAIVKSLVEAHNGEIIVTSKENEGSAFTVKLPLIQNLEYGNRY